MGTRTYRTVLIGAGNVASFLKANIKSPFELTCVGGRNRTSSVPQDADLYIIAVSDRAISSVAQELMNVEGLVVHTAGSVPMDVLSHERRGVFYPLQTISKKRQIPASRVPFYVEASQPQDLELLQLLAEYDIPCSAMLPLIHETADKMDELTPSEAQTGPAVRWDEAVMAQQMTLLNDEQKQLYQLLSKSIHDIQVPETKKI